MKQRDDLLVEVTSRIEDAVGSLSEPDYGFLLAVSERQPYRALIDRLRESYPVQVDFDLNYDRCFECELPVVGGGWSLALSMVGPYAMLHRYYDCGDGFHRRYHLIAPEAPPAESADIIAALEEFGVTLLGKEILGAPIALNIANFERDDPRIYHALFCSLEDLPAGVS